MAPKKADSRLHDLGLRDTQPRRMVLEALEKMKKPASPYDIRAWLAKRGDTVSTVTVYRITNLLQKLGLVHRHACSGHLSPCSLPEEKGVHAYLHCHACGVSQEFTSAPIAELAGKEAANKGFKKITPLLEIVGTCRSCSRS